MVYCSSQICKVSFDLILFMSLTVAVYPQRLKWFIVVHRFVRSVLTSYCSCHLLC